MRRIRKKYKSCVVYLEDLLIDLVGVDAIAGMAGVAGLKSGEAWVAGEDPDGLSGVSAGGTSISGSKAGWADGITNIDLVFLLGVPARMAVGDLKKKIHFIICTRNHGLLFILQ